MITTLIDQFLLMKFLGVLINEILTWTDHKFTVIKPAKILALYVNSVRLFPLMSYIHYIIDLLLHIYVLAILLGD